MAAAQAGEVAALEAMLAADVVTYADGGGVVHAARKPIAGRERVARALIGLAQKFWEGARWSTSTPTGGRRCWSERATASRS